MRRGWLDSMKVDQDPEDDLEQSLGHTRPHQTTVGSPAFRS